jgi:hypothetical protein
MSDCCDLFGFLCCCCLCTSSAGGAWCNSSPNGKCRLCCGSRPRDDIEGLEYTDAFHEQFNAQYDPNHNAIYNETPSGVGHRTVQTQPMGNHGMMTQTRVLGNDAPFAVRPPPDQLPAYSSRPPSTTTTGGNSHRRGESYPGDRVSHLPSALIPGRENSHHRGYSHSEDHLNRPPPALTAGNHRRERSHPPHSSYQHNY